MLEAEALSLTHQEITRSLPQDRTIRVLEAGGGSYTLIRIDRPQRITVVDLSPEQLERNTYADEKILGDLHDERLLQDKYDMIVCWDVLEHLSDPALAFRNMARHLSDGGLLVIGCPNLYSLKGLVTRFTPHWFHVLYYRVVRREKLAGTPGHVPFPTYLRTDMTLKRIVKTAEDMGLNADVAELYHGPALDDLKNRFPRLFGLYRVPGIMMRALTAGRIDLDDTEYVAVFRRPLVSEASLVRAA